MSELVFLEVGVDPEAVGRADRQQVAAGGDIGADLRGAVADLTASLAEGAAE